MGKLRDRLTDPMCSGVYRVPSADEVICAVRGSDLQIARIPLDGVHDKRALLAAIAQVLEFPEWFGGNWDALEDCLTDLSWRRAGGHLLVLEGAQRLARDDFGILVDVLSSSAEYWAERGRPFLALIVNGPASLPSLFRGVVVADSPLGVRIVEGDKHRIQPYTGVVMARRGTGTGEMWIVVDEWGMGSYWDNVSERVIEFELL